MFSSYRGDEKEARKFTNKEPMPSLTSREREWIEEAMKIIIRRVGEKENLSNPKKITMSDLSPLN